MARSTAPSTDAMESAIEWLRSYEGAPGEGRNTEWCREVADWLEGKLTARAVKAAEAQAIREHAAKIGRSPAEVRRALARTRKAKGGQ